MKAIRVHHTGEPDVLKLEEIPDPTPGPGQVLLRVRAAGVNPVETYFRSGKYPLKTPCPFTPGADAAGEIEAVGPGVTQFKRGDRVYTSATITGSYAEKTLCEAKSIHRLPAKITFAQGASLGVPYATAYRALFYRAAGKAGETLLVHGASGGVGTAAVQLARAAGFTVFGTAGTDQGLKQVTENGAHHVFNHHDAKYLDQLMQITGGRGVDIILEMLANENLAKDLNVLARNGRVIVIGNRGSVEINPRELMGRDADVRGMTLFNAGDAELAGIHAAIIAGLENGSLRPVVGKEIPLAEAPRAHIEVMKSGAHGKIVLVP